MNKIGVRPRTAKLCVSLCASQHNVPWPNGSQTHPRKGKPVIMESVCLCFID